MTEEKSKTKWPVTGRKNGHSKGYIRLLCKNHPNSGKDGYVYEHVYSASIVLGRGLFENETAHHIDGETSNNANTNLLICTKKYHQQLHAKLEKAGDWPQFTSKKRNRRPTCKQADCAKGVPYKSATGYCWAHYLENRL